MKLIQVTRISFATTLSVLLCAAVLSGCGASKDSKTATPTIGSTPPPTADDPQTANPNTNGIPSPSTSADGTNPPAVTSPGTGLNVPGETPAPVGKNNSGSNPGGTTPAPEKKKENKNTTPDFKEAAAVKTGGKAGELSYTSASDDGLMEAFRVTSTSVSAEQQTMNKNLAQSITGARLVKNGSDMTLDMTTDEFGQAKSYKLKATSEGNKLKLSLVTSTGDLEFQGGFVKCLEASCDEAYAKIKLQGAYTRIIFRNTNMNNNFRIQQDITDANFKLWTSYIFNTIQGTGGNASIASVKAASFEVLNGRSAMGIQLLTADNQAFSVGLNLLAPESGTELNQPATKYADPSGTYNLPNTAGKTFTLSKAVSAVSLVNNNGKGGLKLKLSIDSGAIWMVLSRVSKTTLSVADVKAFEATVPNF